MGEISMQKSFKLKGNINFWAFSPHNQCIFNEIQICIECSVSEILHFVMI